MIFTVVTNLKSLYFATGYQRLRNLLMKHVTPALARRHFALSFKGIQSNLKMSGRSYVCMLIWEQWSFVLDILGSMSHNYGTHVRSKVVAIRLFFV